MATQTLAALTAENKTFYERTLLKRLIPNLYFYQYGQKKPIPEHEGDTINFRRFNALSVGGALTEGQTPAGSSLTIATVTAQAAQYGDFVEISDKLDMAGIDPVLTETAEVLGEAAALTVDTLIRNVVSAGTNVMYANGRTSTNDITATDVMTHTEVLKAVRALKAANAKPLDGGYFVGLIDPAVAYDLQKDSFWQDISKYNGAENMMKGEIGRLGGVRFVETTNIKTANNTQSPAVSVHSCMILGRDAYGVVDIDGGAVPQMIVKPFGSAGTADPLDQRATAGYKLYMTAVRLQELAMIRVECAASA